jgi:hypothetical protein
MSYHQFAKGCSQYGRAAACRAACLYGVPVRVCIEYLRRYSIDGYSI